MKVQELINELNKFPLNKKIRFFYYDDIYCSNQEAFFDSIEDGKTSIKLYIS